MSRMQVTFSIPVYNDEQTIENLVAECISVGNELNLDYQILIVEDGSSDGTADIVRSLEERHPFLRAIYHEVNMSFGPAYKEVFTLPDTEWICFLSGDHQFHAGDVLGSTIPFIDRYDYIIGRRTKRADNILRKLISTGYNLCVSMISRRRVHDVNSALLFRRAVSEHSSLEGNSAFVQAELYIMAQKGGYRITEVPITHRPRLHGKAGGNSYDVILRTFIDLIRHSLS